MIFKLNTGDEGWESPRIADTCLLLRLPTPHFFFKFNFVPNLLGTNRA